MLTPSAIAFLSLASFATLYYVLSFLIALAFRRKTSPNARILPPISILKPVCGVDNNAYDNFASLCRQDYPEFQIVFALADSRDPAIPIIEKLRQDFPKRDIDLVIALNAAGVNAKVGNLHNAYPKAKHDIVILSDSDIRVEQGYLRALVGFFDNPKVGLVTCPYRTSYPRGLGGILEALTTNTDFIPGAFVGNALGVRFAMGATIAVRREAIEKIGGFAPMASYLADDYQLGYRVAKAGYRLELAPVVVEHVKAEQGISDFLCHQRLLAQMIRSSRPVGYFFSVLTQGLVWALAFAAASGCAGMGMIVLGGVLGIRLLTAGLISEWVLGARGTWHVLWLLPLRDLLGFVTWGTSWVWNRVVWRGSIYRVRLDGRIDRVYHPRP